MGFACPGMWFLMLCTPPVPFASEQTGPARRGRAKFAGRARQAAEPYPQRRAVRCSLVEAA